MKVCFLPIGNTERASSRYRAHWIHPEINGFYVRKDQNWKKANALVFQRTYHTRLARKAQKMGKLIVFDQTDFYWYWHELGKKQAIIDMAKIAHCLTTSNEDDASDMRRLLHKRTYVIPGAQKKSSKIRKHTDVGVPTICWIGRENRMDKTLGSVWPVIHALAAWKRFRLLIVNDTGDTHGLTLPFGCEVLGKKWRLDTVYSVISECDIGICPQEKLPDGKYHKDCNTAVTFGMCGVPCVTSGITENWHVDLRKLLFDWRFRQRQGQKAIGWAQDYMPHEVARQWYKIIAKELEEMK